MTELRVLIHFEQEMSLTYPASYGILKLPVSAKGESFCLESTVILEKGAE